VPEDPRRLAAAAYRALAPAVLGYLRSQRVPDPEDVLGEVFLQVARDIGRFSGDAAALRRWVFSIAHNRSMDAHRKAKRNRSTLEAELTEERVPTATDGPAEPLDPALVAALATLSDEQREVVVLRFVADLPLETVAKITGRSPGAVKAMQHRAMENLRRAVSSAGD
jgi:RNA polymerase sigma factor (sigma-70 family)